MTSVSSATMITMNLNRTNRSIYLRTPTPANTSSTMTKQMLNHERTLIMTDPTLTTLLIRLSQLAVAAAQQSKDDLPVPPEDWQNITAALCLMLDVTQQLIELDSILSATAAQIMFKSNNIQHSNGLASDSGLPFDASDNTNGD